MMHIHTYIHTQHAFKCAAFRRYFYETTGDPTREHDLTSFWLRKTGKVVLAVLLVQKEGGPPKLYRGSELFLRTHFQNSFTNFSSSRCVDLPQA